MFFWSKQYETIFLVQIFHFLSVFSHTFACAPEIFLNIASLECFGREGKKIRST